jgi:hyperosmotically inducible periplasmic protein
MARKSIKVLALITGLSALPLMVGVTGCAGSRSPPNMGHSLDDQRTVGRGSNQSADQSIEDRRMAARVREALAAAPEYKFNDVRVAAGQGVVQLSGFVNTSAQRNRAGDLASKVVGVKSVENNLTIKD